MTKSPYTYRVDDQELLLGFYKKLLWDRMVPRIPARVTPNTLTIVGQILAVLSALAAAAAVAHNGVGGQPVFFIVSAFCMVAYLTFDNIDGAHARRTGQSSVLGEFLDHGLDGVASGSILIVTCLVLHLDGIMMAILCTLGAIGFASLFWEQFRTGILIIPKFSTTEGITVLAIWEIMVAIFGEPEWLHFSVTHITAGTIVIAAVCLAYSVALGPPFVRAAKAGIKGWEMAPFFALSALQVGFAPLGAAGVLPAITVGLMTADLTCRMIILRHRGGGGLLVSYPQYATAIPFVLALALPNVWTPDGWAVLAMAVMVVDYTRNLWRGVRLLLRHARETAS